MNIVLPIEQFNKHHIFFEKSVKNIVLENSDFIKIIYSNSLCVLNNLYLSFHLNIDSYADTLKKRKYFFAKYNNPNLKNIIEIEKFLLKLANIKNVQPSFTIKENIENGYINCVKTHDVFHNESREILLKISGIWVTKTNYGITYKFIDVSN